MDAVGCGGGSGGGGGGDGGGVDGRGDAAAERECGEVVSASGDSGVLGMLTKVQ